MNVVIDVPESIPNQPIFPRTVKEPLSFEIHKPDEDHWRHIQMYLFAREWGYRADYVFPVDRAAALSIAPL